MTTYNQPYTYLIGWTDLNKYYYGNVKCNTTKGMKMPKISAALRGRPNPNKGRKFGPMTEETKAKMAEARKRYYESGGKGPNSGKTMSEEQKFKISNTSKGCVKSEQTKQKMREAKLAYYTRKCLSLNDSDHENGAS